MLFKVKAGLWTDGLSTTFSFRLDELAGEFSEDRAE